MGVRVLVADDDLWVLRMISTVLERRGYTVIQASDGEEALSKARAEPPDLLITDLNMPRLDGWALIASMREEDALSTIPVIVLSEASDEDNRVRGFRLGVEDFVAKPFRFEELDLRVGRIVRRAPTEDGSGPVLRPPTDGDWSSSIGLVGTLDQVSLSSLLTLLELDRKSGTLTLAREAKGGDETARLHFASGRIVAASVEGNPDIIDAECVYHVLCWENGRFEFNQQAIDIEDRIGQKTTSLLMEGMRRIDEAARE